MKKSYKGVPYWEEPSGTWRTEVHKGRFKTEQSARSAIRKWAEKQQKRDLTRWKHPRRQTRRTRK